MKKNKFKGVKLVLLAFVCTLILGCNHNPVETATEAKEVDFSDLIETKEVNLNSISNYELDNSDHKVIFKLSAEENERWEASLDFPPDDHVVVYQEKTDENGEALIDENGQIVYEEVEDEESVYTLGYLGSEYSEYSENGEISRKVRGTGPSNLVLYVNKNTVASSHAATLTVSYPESSTPTKTVSLTQLPGSQNDGDDPDSTYMKLLVGYGYNTRRGYASSLARRGEIFRTAKLYDGGIEIKPGAWWGDDDEDDNKTVLKVVCTQDEVQTSYVEASGSNIVELESSLKETVEGNGDFSNGLGFEMNAHVGFENKSKQDYQYAWMDIEYQAYTAQMKGGNEDIYYSRQVLKPEAYCAINGLDFFSGKPSKNFTNNPKGFKKLIDAYGTHVVVGGILGGKATLTMEANTSEIEGTFDAGGMIKVKYEGDFTLSSETEFAYKETLKNNSNAFKFNAKVRGGSVETATTLASQLSERTSDTSGKTAGFTDWQNSMSNKDNCVFIDFKHKKDGTEIIPLYELLDPNLPGYETRREAMKDYYENGLLDKDFPVPGAEKNVNFTCIKLKTEDLGFNEDGSLLKYLSYGSQTIGVAAMEYIPELNKDQRVLVVYPASNLKVYWNRGLFPGEGEMPKEVDAGETVDDPTANTGYDDSGKPKEGEEEGNTGEEGDGEGDGEGDEEGDGDEEEYGRSVLGSTIARDTSSGTTTGTTTGSDSSSTEKKEEKKPELLNAYSVGIHPTSGGYVVTEKDWKGQTLYIIGTTITACEPKWLTASQIEALPVAEVNDYTLNLGDNGVYDAVKIEGYIFSREYYHGEYTANGTSLGNVDGDKEAKVIVDTINTRDGEYLTLPVKGLHYYPSYLYAEKKDSQGGFLPSGYTIPTVSQINGLLSRLNKVQNSAWTVAKMFQKGGPLGLDLVATGFVGYHKYHYSRDRYYYDYTDKYRYGDAEIWQPDELSMFAVMLDKTDKTIDGHTTWYDVYHARFKPGSSTITIQSYTGDDVDKAGFSHTYRNKAGKADWQGDDLTVIISTDKDDLVTHYGPCFPVIFCKEAK